MLPLGPRGTGRPGGPAPGVLIPLAATFGQLGVDVAIGGSRITGPVLSRRLEAGRGALRHLPHLSPYDHPERAINTLVTTLTLHAVAVASMTDPDLWGLETAVVRALWGATRLSQAKEIVFTVLSKARRVSLIMHTRYDRLLWLAGWPDGRGSPKSSPRPSGNPAAARPGGHFWVRAPHGGHLGMEPS